MPADDFPAARPALVDSHAHLDLPAFAEDRAAMLDRARAAGIGAMVVPAIDASGWPGLHALCQQHAELHPAYGLHPMFLDRHQDDDPRKLDAWLNDHPAVAVGECGLDHAVGVNPERQRRLFLDQLAIARAHDLPVIVHARKAVEAVIHCIRRSGPLRGVVHSYAGSPEQARQLADMGFLIGIGGPLTHARARRLRRTVASVPLHTLLLETDAPDQPGTAHRGQRNEPAWLPEVLACVAELRGESPIDIAAATRRNACRLFGLD